MVCGGMIVFVAGEMECADEIERLPEVREEVWVLVEKEGDCMV